MLLIINHMGALTQKKFAAFCFGYEMEWLQLDQHAPIKIFKVCGNPNLRINDNERALIKTRDY